MRDTLNNHEIRPEDLMKTYDDFFTADMKLLREQDMVHVKCPACKSEVYEKEFVKMKFDFVKCTKCKTLYVNPRPTSQALENHYVHSKSSAFWDKIFQQTESVRKERIFKPRLQLVKKILQDYGITNCKKMIEVGAGYGWFCEMAKEEKIAEEIIAIEPSPKVAQMCKQIGGIRVIESVIERCLDQLDADLMVSFEVVHLLFDPISFLQNCFAKLRNNGILIFSLTNYYGFDIQILQDKSDYITPTFLNLFNPESISKLLESIGYRNIKISTPGLMDLQIVINKSKSGQLDETNCPMGRFLTTCSADFIAELQSLLQKHNLSSHMVVSAQK